MIAKRTLSRAIATLLCMLSSLPGTQAGALMNDSDLTIQFGVEHFHLEEISGAGKRFLEESGPRYVLSGRFGNETHPNAVRLYHLEAAAYTGTVDYNGQTQSVDPAKSNIALNSETEYQGGRLEAMLGYRFRPPLFPQGLDTLVGVGLDNWRRHVKGGLDATDTPVSGIEENYRVYYSRFALGIHGPDSSAVRLHLQAGLTLPLTISEDVKLKQLGFDHDTTVSPGNAVSGFVALNLESRPAWLKSDSLLLTLYYDGYRFKRSDSETVTRSGTPYQVSQPKTEIDIFGLQVGCRL